MDQVGGSGGAFQLGAQPDRVDAVGSQQRASGVDGADGPTQLGEVLSPTPAQMGTVGVVEISQDPVEQVLGRHAGLASAVRVPNRELQGALGEKRWPTQRRAASAAAAPPGPSAGPP